MEKQMVAVLESIHSALSKLDDRIKDLEIQSDISYGDINEDLDRIKTVIDIFDAYYG